MSKNRFIDLQTLKDIHLGESAVLFGSGPSVSQFNFNDLTDEILFGVNECIFLPCQLDYLFVRDFRNKRVKNINPELSSYKAKKKKFVGRDDQDTVANGDIQGSYWYPAAGVKWKKRRGLGKGKRSSWFSGKPGQKIAVYGSTSFDAMQVMLWMGFKKIYLVGHDCNYTDGTFHKSDAGGGVKHPAEKLVDHWAKLKSWSETQYPDVEILSINPVELKMFPVSKIKKEKN